MKKLEGYQRGVNLGGWLSQCVSYEKKHFDTFIREEDICTIAGWGLDHIRLPLDYDVIMEEDNVFKEEGFTYIDNCIGWCKKYGLNVVLDLHKTKGYMFDTAEVANPDLFFETQELQDDFMYIWKELANRYGKYKDMLAFELLNEVVNPDYGQKWNEIAKRAIMMIRDIAPDIYIIIGGSNNNSVCRVPELDAPYDDKIVYTFHCYEPMVFTHQKAPWVVGMTEHSDMNYPTSIEEMRRKSDPVSKEQIGAIYSPMLDHAEGKIFDILFADAIMYAQKMDVPLYCGEYGVLNRAPLDGTVNWLTEINRVFVKNDIGRAIWNYKEKDFGIVDEHYAPIREQIISLL